MYRSNAIRALPVFTRLLGQGVRQSGIPDVRLPSDQCVLPPPPSMLLPMLTTVDPHRTGDRQDICLLFSGPKQGKVLPNSEPLEPRAPTGRAHFYITRTTNVMSNH